MADRPIEILYIRGDGSGLAMGHPEGSDDQIAKENDPLWARVFKSLDARKKEWEKNFKNMPKLKLKKTPSKLRRKKSL